MLKTAFYDGKCVDDMSDIELKGLLITYINNYTHEELISLMTHIAHKVYMLNKLETE